MLRICRLSARNCFPAAVRLTLRLVRAKQARADLLLQDLNLLA
jgi:hypothetical protein